MVQSRGDRHYVSSKHPDQHHFSATVDSQEHAQHMARQLTGKEKDDYQDGGVDADKRVRGKAQKSAESEEKGFIAPERV